MANTVNRYKSLNLSEILVLDLGNINIVISIKYFDLKMLCSFQSINSQKRCTAKTF